MKFWDDEYLAYTIRIFSDGTDSTHWRRVLLHEIAHANVNCDGGHGVEWQREFDRLLTAAGIEK